MADYAAGKRAFGFCDRCGFRYPLRELKQEVVNLNMTNLLVCPECWDPDNPQSQLGRYHFGDPQALRNPRPPLGLVESRSLAGFDPVRGMEVIVSLGVAFLSIS